MCCSVPHSAQGGPPPQTVTQPQTCLVINKPCPRDAERLSQPAGPCRDPVPLWWRSPKGRGFRTAGALPNSLLCRRGNEAQVGVSRSSFCLLCIPYSAGVGGGHTSLCLLVQVIQGSRSHVRCPGAAGMPLGHLRKEHGTKSPWLGAQGRGVSPWEGLGYSLKKEGVSRHRPAV